MSTDKVRLTPDSWKAYLWPTWVPLKLRHQIEDFWGCFGRTSKDWEENCAEAERLYDAPKFGELCEIKGLCKNIRVFGKYVHAWNNIGRVVQSEELFDYCSVHRGWKKENKS